MIERKPFSEIAGLMVRIRKVTEEDRALNDALYVDDFALVRIDCNRIVATIRQDDLFDASGNRFDYFA